MPGTPGKDLYRNHRKMVKFSLIVPAYNEEESIGRCLNSLKKQSYTDFEIIVVNNNSNDKTKQIAQKIVGKVFDEKRQGYVFAVNSGAKKATGKYLSVCDADTMYPESWLKKINDAFDAEKDIAGVYGGTLVNDSNVFINSIAPPIYGLFLVLSKLFGLDNTSGFNFTFRKDFFFKAGGYDERYTKASPDIELGRRIKKLGRLQLDLSIIVYSSTRRFRKKGYIRTIAMYLKLWLMKLFKKDIKMSYDEYNA